MKHKQDTLLLEGAYKAVLLRQNVDDLPLWQIERLIENASPFELDVLEEKLSFAGLGGIAQAARSGLGSVKDSIKDRVKGAYSSAKDNVKGAYDSTKKAVGDAAAGAKDTVKRSGSAVKAGAKQIGKNTSNIYKSAAAEAEGKKRQAEVVELLTTVKTKLAELEKSNPRIFNQIDDMDNLSISEIQNILARGVDSNNTAKNRAQRTGFTGGVRKAAVKAFNKKG